MPDAIGGYVFRLRVKKIEEKFAKTYDAEKVGTAKVEAQMEAEEVSTGWFVVFHEWPIAIGFGREKPVFIENQVVTVKMGAS